MRSGIWNTAGSVARKSKCRAQESLCRDWGNVATPPHLYRLRLRDLQMKMMMTPLRRSRRYSEVCTKSGGVTLKSKLISN